MGCGIWVYRATTKEELQSAHSSTIATAMIIQQSTSADKSKVKHQGFAFLMGGGNQYDPLRPKLANTFMLGEDKYPMSTTETYNLLLNWWDESSMQQVAVQQDNGHTTFYHNNGKEGYSKSKNKKYQLELLCYRCRDY